MNECKIAWRLKVMMHVTTVTDEIPDMAELMITIGFARIQDLVIHNCSPLNFAYIAIIAEWSS